MMNTKRYFVSAVLLLASLVSVSQAVETFTDLPSFEQALYNMVTKITFEGIAQGGGQANAVNLVGNEFAGITLTAGPGAEGLFVGIPDITISDNDRINFFAHDSFPTSGVAVFSPDLCAEATPPPPPPTGTVAPPPPTGTPAPPPPTDTPPAPLPDLYIAEVTLAPPSTIVGERVDVRIVVVNGGTASVGLFSVNLVEEGGYWGEIWEQLGPLAPGGQAILEGTYSFRVAHPENRVVVCVDCQYAPGRVEESNEQNNGYVLMVNVQPAVAEPLPDLYISRVSLDPMSPRVGEEVQVEVEITNGGLGDAGPHTAEWKSNPDTVACTRTVNGVPSGEGIIKRCAYTYTYPHSGQSTYAKADVENDVEEEDEDNNVRYLRVNVRP